MPIYEYRCKRCRRKTTLLVRGFSQPEGLTCQYCGSTDIVRLVSAFSVLKSEESRLDDLASPSSWGDVDENDPRSVARWMRKMGRETGEDTGPEFDELADRMEAGEAPEDMEGESGDELD